MSHTTLASRNAAATAAKAREIEARIRELEATPRALVATDEGTHGTPHNYYLYETIAGERYATHSFAAANATRCTEEQARDDTKGRIRHFEQATADIRAKAAELKRLRKEVAALKS